MDPEADDSGDLDGLDGLPGLPSEMLLLILEQLDLDSLLRCHNVCRSWRRFTAVESIHLPHVLRAYAELTHGTRPLPPGLDRPEAVKQLKQRFRTSVSALPVFAECSTLRDIAVRLRRLDRSWLSGTNTNFASLYHERPVTAVAVDTKAGLIVAGDDRGAITFWDAPTGTYRGREHFSLDGLGCSAPLHIVVEGDLMVIATTFGGIIVAARAENTGSSPFLKVAEIWTRSAEDVGESAASIRMEGHICIVGETGAVSFWDLSRFAGRRFIHMDRLLFVGLTGSRIQRIASHASQDGPFRQHLWELPEESHYSILVVGPGAGAAMGCSRLCPIGCDGGILVSWTDSSVYKLSSNMAPDNDPVWEPQPEPLITAFSNDLPSRLYNRPVGIHARGEQVVCLFQQNGINLFSGRDGVPIGALPFSYGAITCMAVDPAFIVVGTDYDVLCVYYFAPGHQTPIRGQGPSSPIATAAAVRSPSMQVKSAYKRKFWEAMGPDPPEGPLGPLVGSSELELELRMAKNIIPRGRSSAVALRSSPGGKVPRPLPECSSLES
ncbi:hypothetical protein DRE_02408 [Drechslerella stenobrocha 248]|uniref:F-box domain-containing protein n=1 Tax=Drechslerella stenobrocha 248 TaxID=1043628 RepID=W7HXQ2_9PEZI|nr:hypothetical protein DRE_02408 [Drechslerella stenobrocha 248]